MGSSRLAKKYGDCPEPHPGMTLIQLKVRARRIHDAYGIGISKAHEVVARECGYNTYAAFRAFRKDPKKYDEILLRGALKAIRHLQQRQGKKRLSVKRNAEAERTNQWGDRHQSPLVAFKIGRSAIDRLAAKVVYHPASDT
jgi:hypothetical protein